MRATLAFLTALMVFGMSTVSLAAESFRVYAPASKTRSLWIVDAVPKADGGLELKVAEKPDLGVGGWVSASDLEITPDGKFIFAGLRGHSQDFDRIARYRVREDGQAELLGLTQADKIPWGLALSPDAKYLLVSAYTGATLTAYRITTEGGLEKAASLSWDAQISDLITLAPNRAAATELSKIKSRADLDAVIAATADATLKQALGDHAKTILAAAEQHPHVEAVIRTIESAPGSFTKINTTPEALKKAAGGDIAIFDTLTQVSTNILGGKAHDHRKEKDDPYNAAFIEHLGHISSLESVKLEASGIQDAWVGPLLKLKKLKSLSVSGFGRLGDDSLAQLQQLTECPDLRNLELAYFGKATDAGWEKLAGLKGLESFTPRGAAFPGHFFAKFDGWTNLKRINFHSNGLDDEGLGYVCEKFPNLEFIKLWHSKLITDASAEHLKKLKNLKGIEISCSKATAALVRHLRDLPMEYVALEYGVNSPASDAIETVKSIPTLRRLSLSADKFTDTDFTALAGVTQVQELSLSGLELPDAGLPQLQAFAHLKTFTLVRYGRGYPEETQAKVKALLPKVDVKFVK